LAIAFYLTLVTGFVNTSGGFLSLNPYGVGAVSGFVGASARQAVAKLDEIFVTLFRTDRHDRMPVPPTSGPPASA
jgi:hypothetical protein